MKKIILVIAALATFATSCKKNNEETLVTPTPGAWYLSKMIDDIDTISVFYNADKKPVSIIDDMKSENYYSGSLLIYEYGKPLKLVVKNSAAATPHIDKEFIYNNDRITRINNYTSTDALHYNSYDTIIYDQQNVIKVVSFNSDKNVKSRKEFTWSGSNVVKQDIYRSYDPANTAPVLSNTINYTYNTRPSLVYTSFNFWLNDQENPEVLSTNDMIKTETVINGKPEVTTRGMSYDANQLPVTDTIVTTYDNQVNKHVYKYVFVTKP